MAAKTCSTRKARRAHAVREHIDMAVGGCTPESGRFFCIPILRTASVPAARAEFAYSVPRCRRGEARSGEGQYTSDASAKVGERVFGRWAGLVISQKAWAPKLALGPDRDAEQDRVLRV